MRHEFEIIQHTEIEFVKAFILEITTRSFHSHNDLEIGLILEGSITLLHLGMRRVLNEGDIFLLNCNDIHSFERTDQRNLILAIQISPKLTQRYQTTLSSTHFEENIFNKKKSSKIVSLFQGLILEFTYHYYKKKDHYVLECMTLLHMLLYQLQKNCPYHNINEKELSVKKEHSRRLNRMIQYIEANYNQPLSLMDLASLEDLSETYISHFIKNQLGISFQTYLNYLRFERASLLLVNTDLTILNICIETGISSSRYLNNMFFTQFNCSALEYRKKGKRSHIDNEKLPVFHDSSPDTSEKRFQNFDTLKTLEKYLDHIQSSYQFMFNR